VDAKISEAEALEAKRKELEEEEESFKKKQKEIGEKIVKLEGEAENLKKDYEDLEDTSVGHPLDLYNSYLNTYQPRLKIKTWTDSIEKEEGYASNAVEIEMNGEKFKVPLDELDTVAGAVAYQLGKVKDSDFSTHIGKLTTDASKKNTLKTLFTKLKNDQFLHIYSEKSSNVGDTRSFYMFGSESDYTIGNDGKRVKKTTPTPLFPMGEFFALVLEIAPRHNLDFIRALNNTSIVQETTFSILPIGKELTEQEKKDYDIRLKKFYYPAEFSKRKEKKITQGLED